MRKIVPASLIVAALAGSTAIALAQTPATGSSAGAATVGSDVKSVDRAREPGMTTGMTATSPRVPANAPVPNAALSKPAADEAAPAGR